MTREERRILRIKQLAGWRASGWTQEAYCRRESISFETFRRWRRKLGGAGESAPLLPQFAPVHVAQSRRGATTAVHDRTDVWVSSVEVVLGGGRRLRLEGELDERSLVRLIRLLEALPC